MRTNEGINAFIQGWRCGDVGGVFYNLLFPA